MEEKYEAFTKENRLAAQGENTAPRDYGGIGTGKKVGLYGCGFLVLAVILVFIVLAWTGFNVPFVGTEGVGP